MKGFCHSPVSPFLLFFTKNNDQILLTTHNKKHREKSWKEIVYKDRREENMNAIKNPQKTNNKKCMKKLVEIRMKIFIWEKILKKIIKRVQIKVNKERSGIIRQETDRQREYVALSLQWNELNTSQVQVGSRERYILS